MAASTYDEDAKRQHAAKRSDSQAASMAAEFTTAEQSNGHTAAFSTKLQPKDVLNLQQRIGNQAVQRMLKAEQYTRHQAQVVQRDEDDQQPSATTDGAIPSDVETETSLLGEMQSSVSNGKVQRAPGPNITGRFTTIPSGVINATLSGTRLGASFDMIANFTPPSGGNCSAGEYRQYVAGTFTANGNPVVHSLGGGRTLHPTNFQEDGDVGAGTVYGHRSVVGTLSKFDTPDQATGCRFKGHDDPGISSSVSGTVLGINLKFRGDLIDTSNGNAVLATSSWSVVGNATVP